MSNYIHSFKVKNFFSFKEEVVFSFVVDKKAPDSEAYVVADSGERVSKVAMVVGANASGKTNFFRALGLIRNMISTNTPLSSNRVPSDRNVVADSSVFSPFLFFIPFCGNEEEETMLSVDFNIGKKMYEYIVFFDNVNKVIAREVFNVVDKLKQRKTKKMILSRVYEIKKLKY